MKGDRHCGYAELERSRMSPFDRFFASLPGLCSLQVDFPLADVQVYPGWVFALCVLLSSLPCISIPLVALYRLGGLLRKRMADRRGQNPYKDERYFSDL